MKDEQILLDTPYAKKIDFTSEKFRSCSWLWKVGDYIYLSMLWSKKENQGNVTNLIDNIIKSGYGVKVPTPFPKMVMICAKRGFKRTIEVDPVQGNCEVLVKDKN